MRWSRSLPLVLSLSSFACASPQILRHPHQQQDISAKRANSEALNARFQPRQYSPPTYPSNATCVHGHPPNSTADAVNAGRACAVVEAFRFAWDNYEQYAFDEDELNSTLPGSINDFGGWGVTKIDALDTAIVLGQKDIVNKIIASLPSVNFGATTPADQPISLFETTIRWIGGLCAAYDLLKGPSAALAEDESNVDALLTQAESLADHLSYAFDTPTGIPVNTLFFNNRSTDMKPNNSIAGFGTLVLEWTRLSDLSGNTTYAALAQKAESYLLNPQPASGEPFPGLLGDTVNITNALIANAQGGWIGNSDSFYEYLLKMWVYDQSRFSSYKDRWIVAVNSTYEHLISHPTSKPDLTFLAEFNGTVPVPQSEHLACFDGSNILFGTILLDLPSEYRDLALALADGCHQTYNQTATKIGPEQFNWTTSDPNDQDPGIPANLTAFYDEAGFNIVNPVYILRPEVMETYYYAYRLTGNPMYQDWAWEAFVAVNATCRVQYGFSGISDVNVVGGGGFDGLQESFFLAEFLKYTYLIFSDKAGEGEPWQVRGSGNEWVFNTEAHPVRVVGTPVG